MLEVQFGQATDPGKVRTNNEDAMGFFIPASRQQTRSHGYLFAVADGVGGTDLGEIASNKAIQVLVDGFEKAQAGAMLISLLPRLIQHANAAVHDCTLAPEYRGKSMGTTIVACAMRHDQAIVSHVGDSRCYLVRNGRAKQITQDHTLVNEQRKLGIITAAEMATSESRHVITRSLGREMFESEMVRIVTQQSSIDDIARELVRRAVEVDGGDNTTAQVIRVKSVEQVGMYRGRPYRIPT
jgi:protein phosphatase